MMKFIKIFIVIIAFVLISVGVFLVIDPFKTDNKVRSIKINITNQTYVENEESNTLRRYTQNDFDTFKEDYENKELPAVYLTEFLFDGVGMYKAYDLDDFKDSSNYLEVETVKILAININTTGNIELTGEIKGAMIAVNTNNKKGDLNIILNNFSLDTDSKKVPAVYVYNKNITDTSTKVTLTTLNNTNNKLEGGKLKKISLVPSDDLDSYKDIYTGDNKTNYETYTNYYGIYTKEEINNILFAKVTADNEDLSSGDPYYFYKASGAISSDVDLYFEGKGYLEVVSKNKEGIEGKANLTFTGKTGDYYVLSQDDCINTTTDDTENKNARNTLTIDVNSLYAIVSNDADEGDAIDSNGELIINGGNIIALAKTGQDSGLDSSKGTYINGGTVLATGNMYDEIKSDSKQKFIVLALSEKIVEDTLMTLLDSNEEIVFAYKTDRSYTYLIYSSDTLKEETYTLYKDGTIDGDSSFGLFKNITSYTKGDQLAYVNKTEGNMVGGPEGMGNVQEPPEGMPNENNNGERPEKTDGEAPNGNMEGQTPPDKPDGNNNGEIKENNIISEKPTNKEFTISGIVNMFTGVGIYQEDN